MTVRQIPKILCSSLQVLTLLGMASVAVAETADPSAMMPAPAPGPYGAAPSQESTPTPPVGQQPGMMGGPGQRYGMPRAGQQPGMMSGPMGLPGQTAAQGLPQGGQQPGMMGGPMGMPGGDPGMMSGPGQGYGMPRTGQQPGMMGRPGQGYGRGMYRGGPGGGRGMMGGSQAGGMLDAIGRLQLTDEQRTKLDAIRSDLEKRQQDLMVKINHARQDLQSLQQEQMLLSQSLRDFQGHMMQASMDAANRGEELLTDEQRQQFMGSGRHIIMQPKMPVTEPEAPQP